MGDFARTLVLDRLNEYETNHQNINAMKEELSMLNQKVSELRTLLAVATEGLLVGCSSGKPVSVEDAKNWVGKRFSKS